MWAYGLSAAVPGGRVGAVGGLLALLWRYFMPMIALLCGFLLVMLVPGPVSSLPAALFR